ncbi:fluoride efflux transporter CrcB [Permianibacter aggregans]|uniref:Fluoride-specific ion channel FluC n=1 Tax=Permianibacter aggregans TaxID=1510150 RepID=A0A4R6UR29_9GAMM|nr:fluoride efflux transporter CrcB [Permianibacter aggregans]TDQ48666.1 camphor resistance protein CrcB [Permianibacter aggregans]
MNPVFSLSVLAAIAGGAAAGALLRYLTSVAMFHWYGDRFPLATLLVNVVGSFIAGYLLLAISRGQFSELVRMLVIVGFCGALTTFSTFAVETVTLLQQGELIKALLNVGFNMVLCLVAVALGFALARSLLN